MIDTLRVARRLADKGMDREQAEALADAINQGLTEAAVTKADLTATKMDVQATFADVSAALARTKNELIVWQIGIAGVLYGALKFTH